MRIMGLDLSVNATGVCLPDDRVLTIKCKAAWGDHRLQIIRDVIRRYAPTADLAVIEGMGRFKGNTGVIIGMVQGAVRTELLDHDVRYAVVPPRTLKKFATGNGNADKDQMMEAARRRASLIFRDDNQCDAWWLRQAGLDHYDLPVAVWDPDPDLSDLLNVVDWPVMINSTSASA